jgi:putative ABC transport system permease protein
MNRLFDGLLSDIRYGARLLRANPGFTTAVVLILALGIGANTAVFSVVHAVLWKPLPYRGADRIYELGGFDAHPQWISAPDFLTWQGQTHAFEAMAAGSAERYIVTGAGTADEVAGLGATRELMPALAVAPQIGRTFADDDYRADAPHTALIADKFWRRHFGGDRSVLGRSILLNGVPHTVIGVMPPEFQFPDERTGIWTPMSFNARALSRRQWPAFLVWGRARRGVAPRQVEREAQSVANQIARDFPAAHRKGWRMTAASFEEHMVGRVRVTLLVVLGAVGCVLLIACLNVASMLLARASARSKEMALRASLGAGRLRLVRQVLTESAMLSGCGAVLGLAVAAWGRRALLALCSTNVPLPRGEQASIDASVLGFALLVSLVCAVAFGLAPALLVSNVNLVRALKEGGRGAGRPSRGWPRNVLIVAETALSLMLLAGAGLMVRTVSGLMQVNPGFSPERVVSMRLPLPAFRVPDRKQQPLYYAEILRHVQAVPGVQSAALVSALPLGGWSVVMSFDKPLVTRNGEQHEFIAFRSVSPDYFRVMGVPVLKGRPFEESDAAGAPSVAIVNRAMAEQFWPGENPVGQMLAAGENRLIVGVAGDIRNSSLSEAPEPELYLPFLQEIGVAQSVLVARSAAPDPTPLLGAVQHAVRQASPDQPIEDAAPLMQTVSDSFSESRFYMTLLSSFAVLALLLAAAGIYGVMSFFVSRREHEFGVRVAMGATSADLLRVVLSRGTLFSAIGIALGIGGALLATQLLRGLLFGVRPADAATYIVAAAILLAVALAACVVPARRASKVDHMAALRQE